MPFGHRQGFRPVGAAASYAVVGYLLGAAIGYVLLSLGVAELIWRAEQRVGVSLLEALSLAVLMVRLDRPSE